jgi:hypothetical protein
LTVAITGLRWTASPLMAYRFGTGFQTRTLAFAQG